MTSALMQEFADAITRAAGPGWRPTGGDRAGFYAERRLLPRLRSAVDTGRLAPDLAAGVQRVIDRLPALTGPEFLDRIAAAVKRYA